VFEIPSKYLDLASEVFNTWLDFVNSFLGLLFEVDKFGLERSDAITQPVALAFLPLSLLLITGVRHELEPGLVFVFRVDR